MILGIVLGVIAILVALGCLFWFFQRRQKRAQRAKERPVNLMYGDEEDDREESRMGGAVSGSRAPSRLNELPEFYQPEPYMVTDPGTDARTTMYTSTTELEEQRPLSGTSTSFYTRVTTPDLYGGSSAGDTILSGTGTGAGQQSGRRKGGAPRMMRPVNIIQHDDAGPSVPHEGGGGELETIELPPAYTALRGAGTGTSASVEGAARMNEGP